MTVQPTPFSQRPGRAGREHPGVWSPEPGQGWRALGGGGSANPLPKAESISKVRAGQQAKVVLRCARYPSVPAKGLVQNLTPQALGRGSQLVARRGPGLWGHAV